MTMTDKEPQDLNELVIAKLTAYAAREQFEGEIAGRYGYLSTPRQEMIIKIRAKWWDTPDGQAVRDLVRERGEDPADLTTIQKSHSEGTPPSLGSMAEVSGGNGVVSSPGLIKREIQDLRRPPDVPNCPLMSSNEAVLG